MVSSAGIVGLLSDKLLLGFLDWNLGTDFFFPHYVPVNCAAPTAGGGKGGGSLSFHLQDRGDRGTWGTGKERELLPKATAILRPVLFHAQNRVFLPTIFHMQEGLVTAQPKKNGA